MGGLEVVGWGIQEGRVEVGGWVAVKGWWDRV